MMQILQPPGWAKPKGYSNGISADGKLVFVAGQIGWTGEGKWEAKDFASQFRQTLKNTLAVLAEAGARPEHIVRMTWYILDKQEYLGAIREVGAAYRELIGRHYPAMAVVQVGALMEDEARVEIETTAVIP
jgi:enamine deaminase RidA (YjgF/YER057c/UK114 family)